jgi:nucleoside-diphosphate-sugar epimerase
VRVLVIGGTRFMGPYAVETLLRRGHDITVFHRGETRAARPSGVTELLGDRAHLPEYAEPLRAREPEVVLDMFAMTEAHARGLLETFAGVARRAVVASSVDVYRAYGRIRRSEPGPPEPTPLAEDAPLREVLYLDRGSTPRAADDPLRWLDDYDKIAVERACASEPRLPCTILRLPMVHGPRDYRHRLFPYWKRMADGRPAILLDERVARWRGPRGYVENVAAAIALAVEDERASGRTYNVADRWGPTQAEWVREIGRAAGWRGEVVSVPRGRMPIDHDPDQPWDLDTTRIRAELGYEEPVPSSEGLARTVAWERENPPAAVDPADFDYAAEDDILRELSRRAEAP